MLRGPPQNMETNYRNVLKEEWTLRAERNPRYSLRSFALAIGLAPSTLSEVLSGKKNLSLDKALAITEKLGLSESKKSYFIDLVKLETSQSESVRMKAIESLEQNSGSQYQHNLTIDSFKVIADWYHYPIMELVQVSGFVFNPRNIAAKLGISTLEASNAIERLERLELIEKLPSGKYGACKETVIAKTPGVSDGLRKFHRQMLHKAIEAIDVQSNQEKSIGSETFAFDSRQLAQANQIIEECFDKMLKLSRKTKNKDHVYHMGIQLFKITNNK